jgi:hypothetical protein
MALESTSKDETWTSELAIEKKKKARKQSLVMDMAYEKKKTF